MAKEQFLDELVGFFGDPIFQIPIRTYMDENCLTFDPDVGPSEDHKKIYDGYKKLFNVLLKAFCNDAGTSVQEAVDAFDKMCQQNKDLKEYFEIFYDQVMASTDEHMFFAVMAKWNIMIQQQVLVMILAATGSMPASFSLRDCASESGKPGNTAGDKQEEELLKQVMKASEEEHRLLSDLEQRERDELQHTLELSKAEAEALSQERKHLEQVYAHSILVQKLEKMTLEPTPLAQPAPKPVATITTPPKPVLKPAKSATASIRPVPVSESKSMSSSDAASAWLSSAQEEASKQSAAHAAVAKNLAKMSPNEIKQREEYLKSQRDKLMAMKKAKREDQLLDAVKKNPQRPCSARAARSAMANTAPVPNEDDERQMAMRRAIAEKLKQEVIRK